MVSSRPTGASDALTDSVEMKMYCPTFPFSTWPASRTQKGSVVGLSMQTSHSRPFSEARSPVFRSPVSSSTSPGHMSGLRPRLKSVSLCPRASA